MSHTQIEKARIEALRAKYHAELYDNVLPFWLNHSLDRKHGGFYNCLDRDGSIFDTKKHIWLQGRQVWMMSLVHNHLGLGEDSPYLEAAKLGADFLRRFARDGKRVYFCLTEDGKPYFLQRKMFSECFYVMAMAEYARAAKDDSAKQEARDMFANVVEYARDPSLLGRPSYPHLPAESSLAVPMILLNLMEELYDEGEERDAELEKWCVDRIHLHIRPELNLVLETVGADGSLLKSPEGRLVNPGHAIECGWFLLAYAQRKNDTALARTAINMIDWSYDFGWDEKFGGLFCFLDAEGYSPLQLEWSSKLWWPHNEATIAFLMAYQSTGDDRYFKKFEHLTDYSFTHFADPEFGEWYGYLDRRGEPSQRFKGGPYKGCFHVPRSLFIVEGILNDLIDKQG